MRFVSYLRDGKVRHGRLEDDETIAELGDGDLQALVERGLPNHGGPQRTVPLGAVELRAPLQRPGKLLAAAANYQDHVTETGGDPLDKTRLSPRLFLKPPTSIVGPGAVIPLPEVSHEIDWEAELAVVIGRPARNVTADDALEYVAGYMASNDVSARSMDYGFERDTDDKAVWFFDWLAGKWCDGFAPLGPWLLSADAAGDPQAIPVRLDVNGVTKQHGSTKDMIFTVAELIAHASRLMTLEPGDVILTGTPSGVGAATGEYLRAGDEMTVDLGPLGTLRNTVA
ncbi:fumarylacetoacetate hydrolase family protein [Dactylosporangium sp. McL0621]|uniref:fumarylacetoacetate hydrolase family protein n=1 Tax=Dactylosporangium sp. McL0621 TaxID=3415678 RepID=UPI003CF6C0F2